MLKGPSAKHFLWWAGLAGWVGLTLAVLTIGLLLFWYRQSADYPGSLYMGDHMIYVLSPMPTIRRDTAYRSTDDFRSIYGWYSGGFKLGPEAYALSSCITMARSFTDFGVLQRDMSVTVCDTPKERLIFVMRTVAVQWP
jgi:hypothetical protein